MAVVVAVMGVGACAQPQQQPGPVSPAGLVQAIPAEQLRILVPVAGVTYRGTAPFLGRELALPPGEWSLLIHSVARVNNTVVGAAAFLVQSSGTTVQGILYVSGTVPLSNGSPLSLANTCTVSDVIEANIRSAGPTGDLDCLAVNFASVSVMRTNIAALPRNNAAAAGAAGFLTGMFQQVDAHNLVLPPTLVSGNVTLRRGGSEWTVMRYYNPDLEHITPDPSPRRVTNGWALFNLDRDPAKRAFVKRVLTETEAYRLRLIESLDGPMRSLDQPVLRSTSLVFNPAG